MALLLHKSTLKSIRAYSDDPETSEEDEPPRVIDHFHESARTIQLLPRCCPNLETLELEEHEMDMEDVEDTEWICKRLKRLRVRFRGLDTPEKVNRVLEMWHDEEDTDDEAEDVDGKD